MEKRVNSPSADLFALSLCKLPTTARPTGQREHAACCVSAQRALVVMLGTQDSVCHAGCHKPLLVGAAA